MLIDEFSKLTLCVLILLSDPLTHAYTLGSFSLLKIKCCRDIKDAIFASQNTFLIWWAVSFGDQTIQL